MTDGAFDITMALLSGWGFGPMTTRTSPRKTRQSFKACRNDKIRLVNDD
jgi:thiamine biosynthesis lipoprotein ApbE